MDPIIEKRIRALERSQRWMALALTIVGLSAVSAMVYVVGLVRSHQGIERRDTVVANKFVLVDDQGRPHAELSIQPQTRWAQLLMGLDSLEHHGVGIFEAGEVTVRAYHGWHATLLGPQIYVADGSGFIASGFFASDSGTLWRFAPGDDQLLSFGRHRRRPSFLDSSGKDPHP